MTSDMGLEHKFARFGAEVTLSDGAVIEGYASRFNEVDHGGEIVMAGAYRASIKRLAKKGQRVKMLWQHDPAQPIGVWDEVREDATGLWVKGRILDSTQKGSEAAALIQAGAIDGLSIGFRTRRAQRNEKGQRLLTELELWEVSLVTFPMLPSARVAAKGDAPQADDALRELAAVLKGARLSSARD
ncbi:MAG: HK97 family phage prohead protease [Rhodobacteraceae bacterium]|nr:HK97 family phage prohead protease [Paracoccaceae bacterium]